jgi:hypothetical protein
MPGVLALLGVILLILAGLGVAAPRFQPGWLGLGLLALALMWAPITAIGG